MEERDENRVLVLRFYHTDTLSLFSSLLPFKLVVAAFSLPNHLDGLSTFEAYLMRTLPLVLFGLAHSLICADKTGTAIGVITFFSLEHYSH